MERKAHVLLTEAESRWMEEADDLIDWLRKTELPDRFQLNPWTYCTDGRKLKTTLLGALETDSMSETARLAIYQLIDLRSRFGDRRR